MPRQKYRVPQTIAFKQPDGTLNVFTRNEELGRGSFSIVYRVIHQNTNKIYAMKVISKKRYSKNKASLEDLKNEIKIQKMVKHPNIVSLDYSFTDGRNQYFILEYCPGRTIREYLNKSSNYRIKEPEARKILKDVIQGLIYIHGQGITHYDIKLENFVIDSKGNIKIGDFGLSTFHKDEIGKKFSIFGTYNYLSPEMLSRKNRDDSSKVDIWAVGVSAFYMLTGRPPFEGKTKEIIFNNILRCDFRFPLNFPISKEAKDFIRSILQLDPRKRPTAKELLSSPFLNKIDNEEVCLYKPNSSCLPPLNKDQNDNKKITLCPPLFDDKIKSTTTSNLKSSNCNKPISARPNMVNQNSPLLIPIKDNNKPQIKQSPLLEPISSTRSNLKTPLCSPLNKQQAVAPRPFSSKVTKQQICDEIKPVIPKQNFKKAFCPPLNEFKPISARCLVVSPCTNNNKQAMTVNTFIIPHYFVSRYCFLSNEMCYLLLDGTVGVCFKDKTRIVMDPDEIFVQFYKELNTTFPDVIQLGCNIKDDCLQEKVNLVIKAATHFKKIRFSFDLPEHEYESSVILHNIKCFVKSEDSILFELDDMNFQINFNDNVKLIIFWSMKKLCFVRSIREKCALLDLNTVASMNSNSDELKKFKNAKILLSDLSLTLC